MNMFDKFSSLLRGADAEQLNRASGDSEHEPFDPFEALEKMNIRGMPEEIELPEPDLTTGTEAVRDTREYGAGVTLPDSDISDSLVLGHGAGVTTPLTENTVTFTGLGSDHALEDEYAEQRAQYQAGDQSKAMRFNEGKLRFDLIPPEAVEGLAGIYTMGAKKYADRNWEKGLQLMGCFASLMRHAWKWAGGEDLDPESGLHHMDHVAWNAVAISTFFKRGRTDLDDRPTKPLDFGDRV